MSRPRSTRGLLTEGMVVVGSILLAFAIDAAWDWTQDASHETALLTALLEELRTNAELFDTNSEFQQEQISRTTALLELSAATEADVSTDSIDHLLAGLSSWSGDVYERGALDAVVRSGELALITDQALRRQIAEWDRALDVVADVEADEENNIREYWLPFLQANTYMPQVWNVGLERIDDWWAAGIPTRKTEDHSPLLRDRAFTNLVLIRQMTHEDIFHFHEQTTDRLHALVAALEERLGLRRGAP